MKKNNKILLPLLIASFAMAGCGSNPAKATFDSNTKIIANSGVVNSDYIEIQDVNFEVAVGQKKQINIHSIPEKVKTLGVTFTSLDEEVATVDENGVVEGIKEGVARIDVKSKDGKFNTPMNIYVQSEISGADLDSRIESIAGLYSGQQTEIKKFSLHEFSMEKYYEDGVLDHGYSSVETMHYDGESGYFMIESTDLLTKVKGDHGQITSGTWIFAVLSQFQTRMIHISENAKNYVDFPTGDLRSEENYELAVLTQLLDSFFVSGMEIVSDQISYISGAESFPEAAEDISEKAYSFGEDTLSFVERSSWSNQVTFSADEILHNGEIPAGTITNDTQISEYHYSGNQCLGLDISAESLYQLNGKNMKREFSRNMLFDSEFEKYEHTYKSTDEMKELGFKAVKDLYEL